MRNDARRGIIKNRFFIQATRTIRKGSGILVGYGNGYWQVVKENKQ